MKTTVLIFNTTLLTARPLPICWTFQPQQKKFLDDTERRINLLFDDLNCEVLPAGTIGDLLEMMKGERSLSFIFLCSKPNTDTCLSFLQKPFPLETVKER